MQIKFNREITIYILVIVIFLIFLLVISPYQLKSFFHIWRQSQNIKKEIKQIKKDIATQPDILLNIKKTKEDLLNYKNKIIPLKNISSFQAFLYNKAKKWNVKISNLSLSSEEEVANNFYGRIFSVPFLMQAESKFHDLGHFFSDLENNFSINLIRLSIRRGKVYNIVDCQFEILSRQ